MQQSLTLDGQPISRVPDGYFRILGVATYEKGGSTTWLQHLRLQCRNLLRLITRISNRTGGAGLQTARTLEAVLVPRTAYGVMCLNVTEAHTDTLELRIVTRLLRHTRVEELYRNAHLPLLKALLETTENSNIWRQLTHADCQLLHLDST